MKEISEERSAWGFFHTDVWGAINFLAVWLYGPIILDISNADLLSAR